ncbi:MAG TPA: hypothetical protein VH370_25815 [Humisphaera sp.]|nr:hypothetical protein [Humisphaera sp.]
MEWRFAKIVEAIERILALNQIPHPRKIAILGCPVQLLALKLGREIIAHRQG